MATLFSRVGLCSLVCSVVGMIVLIVYRAALKNDTATTDNWTGGQERWTDMGLMVIGTVFGLPAVSVTHALAYATGYEDTIGDCLRVFVMGAMQLCSSAMLLTVSDRGAADQGRAAGISMGVLLLLVSLCQGYHSYVIYRTLNPGSSGRGPYGASYAMEPPRQGRNRAAEERKDRRTASPLVSDPIPVGAAAAS
ncbi:unnamed protein product [Notodromas monacha]|uniref:Uncharacterized protein n=1 Tax=Notodromas monacha TaxID=399045 RepID=A0A7R9BED9_9CRUS|nr:unnamed protein product [Notodromas monacha]CAG0912220.1 unnamed protein product [Notodromas monacha]